MTIDETVTERFRSNLCKHIKESNIPIEQLDVHFNEEKAFIKDKIAGRIVGEIDVKITMERCEPKKMTRREAEKAILDYCGMSSDPCKERKCFKKCAKKMPFEWLSNEGLQKYYDFLYGVEIEVVEE